MRKSVVMMLMALASFAGWSEITGVITKEGGDTQKGVIRWSARDKAYAVTTKEGIEIQIKPADVDSIVIDKPAGFDEAKAQVEKGQGAAVIPVLEKIVKTYAHLEWDKSAGRYLAQAYIAAGKAEDGYKVCQSIISSDSSASFKGDLAPAYWDALMALGKRSQLDTALEKAARSGDRFSSGAALIKRGDVLLKDGKETVEAAKMALSDGYLRVVLLYRDTEVATKLQPEALYKAGKCFEKIGQSGRADAMRNQLKQQYPNSIWASK